MFNLKKMVVWVRQQQSETRQLSTKANEVEKVYSRVCADYTHEREREWVREAGRQQHIASMWNDVKKLLLCLIDFLHNTFGCWLSSSLIAFENVSPFLIAACRAACMRERTKWACDRTMAKTQFLWVIWEIQQGWCVYSRVNITQYMRDALALLSYIGVLRSTVYIYMLYCTLSLLCCCERTLSLFCFILLLSTELEIKYRKKSFFILFYEIKMLQEFLMINY